MTRLGCWSFLGRDNEVRNYGCSNSIICLNNSSCEARDQGRMRGIVNIVEKTVLDLQEGDRRCKFESRDKVKSLGGKKDIGSRDVGLDPRS